MLNAFGPGILYVTRTDIQNATPINIGYSNEFSTDFSSNVKELYGQNQYPLDVARGTVKITGKAKAATISGIAWNSVFFGETFQSGGIQWNSGEAHSVPAVTTYTVTVTNSATFDQDLGVIYAATGLPLTKVAAVTAIGQYSVSAGVYTFYSGDASAAVLISYTSTVTTGQTLPITNHLLGFSPTFQLDYYTSRNNKPFVARFNKCVCPKMSIASKLEDFQMPDFDFSIFADPVGNVGKLVFPEIS
ncbi:hypothetical protein OGR47_02685 [Methylocystis sp. MJC1]|uniref:hypothetical protein n=1 Tax=Methylocystis sp. MJC1 TaxID=2654282 RepID=UPI0013EC40D8|nr:hypothetical protein [Methylocystis sp. MJC1]KAF2991157.1 hypothetical protein MJC1_01890 [Methylocystis sp. MJC1]MBU6525920.1 hypothetical protein [Methylocystis sp. MJC1]UZX12386.1 hypothetical protein OGR47_02685 [Methylocystis sp. MJC1]